MKLIGLSGTNGSGKDTIAHLLRDQYGWYFAGASEMLGEELTKRGLSHERANKSALSAEWRSQYGDSAVVDKGIELCKESGSSYDGLIVGSLRHPGEADKIHEQGGLVLWVDADPQIRYARIIAGDRGRIEDKKTYEEFLAEQEAEMKPSAAGSGLHIAAVKERSDIFIENSGDDIEAFKKQVIKVLKDNSLI